MNAKHDATKLVPLSVAFAGAVVALLTSRLPFLPAFSALIFITMAVESLGKTPVAFFLSAFVAILGYFCQGSMAGVDSYLIVALVILMLLGITMLHGLRVGQEKKKWRSLIEKDEEYKEVKNLRQEMVLYEQRLSELSNRTAHRRQLSAAARELGGLLDPSLIQAKLLQITQSIFSGQRVEISVGQHRDAVDNFIFQKRQPLLVPSEQMPGVPMLAAPIFAQKSVAGVLRVGGEGLQEPRRAFTREDLRLLEVLGGLASLALDNCQLFQQIQQSALRDNLTGLLTQRSFQEELESAILEASRYNQPLSLILADVDHFKKVNDTYGHQAGDQVLQGFAHILDRNVRNIDIIARYGGEEFAILMLQTSHREALDTAERIRTDLADQGFETEKGTLFVTSSFGVATFPEDATSGQQLFRQADQRLYKAKNSGRNQSKGRGV